MRFAFPLGTICHSDPSPVPGTAIACSPIHTTDFCFRNRGTSRSLIGRHWGQSGYRPLVLVLVFRLNFSDTRLVDCTKSFTRTSLPLSFHSVLRYSCCFPSLPFPSLHCCFSMGSLSSPSSIITFQFQGQTMEIDTAAYVDTMVKIPSKVGYVLSTSLGYFLGLSAKVYDVCVENFPHDTIRIYGEKAGKILDDVRDSEHYKRVAGVVGKSLQDLSDKLGVEIKFKPSAATLNVTDDIESAAAGDTSSAAAVAAAALPPLPAQNFAVPAPPPTIRTTPQQPPPPPTVTAAAAAAPVAAVAPVATTNTAHAEPEPAPPAAPPQPTPPAEPAAPASAAPEPPTLPPAEEVTAAMAEVSSSPTANPEKKKKNKSGRGKKEG